MKNYSKLSILLLTIIFVIGCSDTENLKSDEPKVVNGKLAFNDYAGLESFVFATNGKEKTTAEVEEKAKSLGLKSHLALAREIYGAPADVLAKARQEANDEISQYLSPADDSIRLSAVVDDKLASVLNEKQEIVFGNVVHKIQNDYVFMYKEGSEALVKDYYKALNEGKIEKPTVGNVVSFGEMKIAKSEIKMIDLLGGDGAVNGRTSANCESNLSSNLRLSGVISASNYYFYQTVSITVNVKSKSRRCFLWWCSESWNDTEANYLAANFEVSLIIDRFSWVGPLRGPIYGSGPQLSTRLYSKFEPGTSSIDLVGWACYIGQKNGFSGTCSHRFTTSPRFAPNPASLIKCP